MRNKRTNLGPITSGTVALLLTFAQLPPSALAQLDCDETLFLAHPLEGFTYQGNVEGHFLDNREKYDCMGSYDLNRLHSGDDYNAPDSTHIVAVEDGALLNYKEDDDSHWDNYILLGHTSNRQTRYVHLLEDSIPDVIIENPQVPILISDKIGETAHYHLHFGVHCNGPNSVNLVQPCLFEDTGDEDGIQFIAQTEQCALGPSEIGIMYPSPMSPGMEAMVRFCAFDNGAHIGIKYPGILKAVLLVDGVEPLNCAHDMHCQFDLTRMGYEYSVDGAHAKIFDWQEPICGIGRYYFRFRAPMSGPVVLTLKLWDCKDADSQAPTRIWDSVPVGIDRWVDSFQAEAGIINGEIIVSWIADDFDNGTMFHIHRSSDGGVTYADVGQTPFVQGPGGGPSQHFFLDQVEYNMSYVYRLWDSEGGSGAPGPDPWWDPPAEGQPEGPPPDPPVPSPAPVVSITSVGADRISGMIVTGSSYAESYVALYAVVPPGDEWLSVECTRDGGFVVFEIDELTTGVEYDLKVRGLNSSGQVESASTRTMPITEPFPTYAVPGYNTMYVSWPPVDGAAGYKVHYWVDQVYDEQVVDVGSQLNTAIQGLSDQTMYCAAVSAYNAYGHDTNSPSVQCVMVGGEDAVSVSELDLLVLSSECLLSPAFPNPFNPSTELEYVLPDQGPVTLSVWDAMGRRVRTLVDRTLEGGEHKMSWDGRDDKGRELPSGVYFLRLSWRNAIQKQKVVLVR